jgi:hypothetical protein
VVLRLQRWLLVFRGVQHSTQRTFVLGNHRSADVDADGDAIIDAERGTL